METDLVIRAILLKNNEVIFNFSFKIQGTDNVHDATIAAANKVCNLFLGFALKGDTIVCSLGAGYNSAHTYITITYITYITYISSSHAAGWNTHVFYNSRQLLVSLNQSLLVLPRLDCSDPSRRQLSSQTSSVRHENDYK